MCCFNKAPPQYKIKGLQGRDFRDRKWKHRWKASDITIKRNPNDRHIHVRSRAPPSPAEPTHSGLTSSVTRTWQCIHEIARGVVRWHNTPRLSLANAISWPRTRHTYYNSFKTLALARCRLHDGKASVIFLTLAVLRAWLGGWPVASTRRNLFTMSANFIMPSVSWRFSLGERGS